MWAKSLPFDNIFSFWVFGCFHCVTRLLWLIIIKTINKQTPGLRWHEFLSTIINLMKLSRWRTWDARIVLGDWYLMALLVIWANSRPYKGVIRTLTNIYDGAFLWKYSQKLFSQKVYSHTTVDFHFPGVITWWPFCSRTKAFLIAKRRIQDPVKC